MLRKVLLTIGLALLLIAAAMTARGNAPAALWCGVNGAVITLGIVFERWQYRRSHAHKPGAGWQLTGERFVDPGSGAMTEVWFEPKTGERRYVEIARR
jgi:hypothetical protein